MARCQGAGARPRDGRAVNHGLVPQAPGHSGVLPGFMGQPVHASSGVHDVDLIVGQRSYRIAGRLDVMAPIARRGLPRINQPVHGAFDNDLGA